MYNDFFGFREAPFSIAPDPRYLYLSERHKEALAHLMYGVQGQGGFIVITGEVGTGKTTVCRCFLDSVPDNVDIALVLNPKLSARELLASICDELQLRYPAGSSIKRLIDLINSHLLNSYAQGRHTVLVIDEAQNLSADVLEQLRLLTNLETAEKKLLQIVLLGQPELQEILGQRELRQLSQRITARYHLDALDREELPAYLRYRLSVAGNRHVVFSPSAIKAIYRLSKGIPRLINLIADRALLGAYAQGVNQVDGKTVRQAGREVLGNHQPSKQASGDLRARRFYRASLATCLVAIAVLLWTFPITDLGRFDEQAEVVQSPQDDAEEVSARADPLADEAPAGAAGVPTDAPPEGGQAETPLMAQVSPAVTESQGQRPVEDFSELLGSWRPGPASTGEAYRELFAVWGVDFDPERSRYACEFAEQEGLSCLHRQGNWRSLEQLDHPAVLRLFNRAGEAYHVALLRLEAGQAGIALDGEHYSVDRAVIDEHWLGDYSVLWRLPPYQSRTVVGAVGKTQWLTEAMAAVRERYGVEPAVAEELSNAPLEEQVVWFQRHAGLIPDGIPGAVTLIWINKVLDPTLPRLNAGASSKHLAQQD